MKNTVVYLNDAQLAAITGGDCNWGDFAKAGVGAGFVAGVKKGLKTGTWQGAAIGAAGGALLGGAAYGLTCWW